MARPSSRRSSPTSLTIRPENNHPERTRRLLFAEGDEVDSSGSGLHVQDSTRYASGFADVLAGFAHRGGQSEANSRVQSGMASATPRRAGLRGAGSPLRLRSTPALGGCAHLHASELPQVTILRGEHTARALGREKSKRLPGMKPAHRQSTDALRFGPAPRS